VTAVLERDVITARKMEVATGVETKDVEINENSIIAAMKMNNRKIILDSQ